MVPLDRPTTMVELGSRQVPAFVRAAWNVPTGNAASVTDRFLAERVLHTVTDVELALEQHVQQARTQAGPLY
jgi:hypothetical protein